MASPFPGMDPYLEDPEIWSGFHSLLAGELLRRLNPLIVPKYYADLEVHTVLQEVGINTRHNIYPDAAVLELTSKRAFQGGCSSCTGSTDKTNSRDCQSNQTAHRTGIRYRNARACDLD